MLPRTARYGLRRALLATRTFHCFKNSNSRSLSFEDLSFGKRQAEEYMYSYACCTSRSYEYENTLDVDRRCLIQCSFFWLPGRSNDSIEYLIVRLRYRRCSCTMWCIILAFKMVGQYLPRNICQMNSSFGSDTTLDRAFVKSMFSMHDSDAPWGSVRRPRYSLCK